MGRHWAATLGRSVAGVAMLFVVLTTAGFAQYQYQQPAGCKTALRPGVRYYGLPYDGAMEQQTLHESEYYRKQIGRALDSTYGRLSQSQDRLRQAQSDADYAAKTWLSAEERAFHAETSQADAAGRLEAATKRLRAIEAAILAAQQDDSPYGRLRAAAGRAVDDLKRAEQRVLASPEFRRRRAAVDARSARPIELLQLRRRLLEDDATYQRIKADSAEQKQQLNAARAELFHNNPGWQAATDQIVQARDAKSTSRRNLSRSRRDRSRAESDLRRSQASAAAEQRAIEREDRRATSLRFADQQYAAQQRRILGGW